MNRTFFAMTLLAGVTLSAAAEGEAKGVREKDLDLYRDLSAQLTAEAPCDLGASFAVATLEDDPALTDLSYSAVGWDIVPLADATRTVTIVASPGAFVDGVFTPDGSGDLPVLPATTGRGAFKWTPEGVSKKLYRLTHTVKKGSTIDATATLYGYMDFTHIQTRSSQREVEVAVLDEVSQSLSVTQDATWPWQPIDTAAAHSGIRTDELLASGARTATTFSFKGVGMFRYQYQLDGGQLTLVVDGKAVVLEATGGAWTDGSVTFDVLTDHVVTFVYVAAGDGSTAGLRRVSRDLPEETAFAANRTADIRVDLRDGTVRTLTKSYQLLPFVYSPTNFIGTVNGKVSRVSVVRLTGEDPDVTTWTEEVSGSARVLKESTQEGEVIWPGKPGVWKATFDIVNDKDKNVHHEVMFFDLRNFQGAGLVISII